MIHHGLTAELNTLRIAELNAEAERRRLQAAVPKDRHRPMRRLVTLARTFTQRRSSTVSSSPSVDSAAEQCA